MEGYAFDCDEEIDLFRDGVLLTSQKLIAAANGGECPEGGLDLPAHGGLSRVREGEGDLHVEIAPLPTVDVAHWSIEDELAPATRAMEPSPADTRPPFDFPIGNIEMPGLLGKAAQAFLELIAVLEAYGRDTKDFIRWFRDSWGLSDVQMEEVLYARPVVRGKGDTVLAAVGRTLRPAVLSEVSSQAMLRVVDHGHHRREFGEHKIVDWARVRSIATAMTLGVVANDRVARAQVRRIDFRIVDYEVPNAPQTIDIPPLPATVPYDGHVRAEGLCRFIAQARSIAQRGPAVHAAEGSLDVASCEFPQDAIHHLRPKGVSPFGYVPSFRPGVDDDMDIDEHRRQPAKASIRILSPSIALRNVFLGASDRPEFLRPAEIRAHRSAIAAEEPGALVAAAAAVRQVATAKSLALFASLGNMHHKGGGREWIKNLYRESGADRSAQGASSLSNAWQRLLTDRIGLDYLLQAYLSAATLHARQVVPKVRMRAYRIALNTGDIGAGLGALFDGRRRYWSKRYRHNSRTDRLRRPMYQVLSKAFSRIRVHVDENGEASLVYPALANALCDSAKAFVRKRRDKEVSYSVLWDAILQGRLDDQVSQDCGVRPAPSFAQLAVEVQDRAAEFVEDVRKVAGAIMDNDDDVDLDTVCDSPHQSDDDFESEQAPPKRQTVDLVVPKKPVVFSDSESEPDMPAGPAPKMSLDSDSDASMSEEDTEAVGQQSSSAGRVEVREELREDGYSLRIIEEACAGLPDIVTIDEYKAAGQRARLLALRPARASTDTQDLL